MKRGPYKPNQKSLEGYSRFLPFFRLMVDNARANFGELDTDRAALAIPNVDGISPFDLKKKINVNYGNFSWIIFKQHFGKAVKVKNLSRIKKNYSLMKQNKITQAEFDGAVASRCYDWCWKLLPDKMLPPTH